MGTVYVAEQLRPVRRQVALKLIKPGMDSRSVLARRLDRTTAAIEGETTGDPLAVARMQMDLGRSQLNLGYPARAIELFNRARATFSAGLGPDHPDTLTSMSHLAIGYATAGQLDRALPIFEETLASRRAKLGPDHPDTLESMNTLADSRPGWAEPPAPPGVFFAMVENGSEDARSHDRGDQLEL